MGLAVLAWAAVSPTAHAATLDADTRCQRTQPEGNIFTIRGTGFTPNARIALSAGGAPLEPERSDSSGAISFRVRIPPLRPGRGQELYTITAGDGRNRATTASFGNTLVQAGWLRQTSRLPARARANFYVFGFAGGGPIAYLHYISPGGSHAGSVALGRLRGPCGALITGQRRLLPFTRVRAGIWGLRWDTLRAFTRRLVPPFQLRALRVFGPTSFQRCGFIEPQLFDIVALGTSCSTARAVAARWRERVVRRECSRLRCPAAGYDCRAVPPAEGNFLVACQRGGREVRFRVITN